MRRHLVAALVALPAAVLVLLGLPLALERDDQAVRELFKARTQQARAMKEMAAEVARHGASATARERIADFQDRTGGRVQLYDVTGRPLVGALCILSPGELRGQEPVRAALRGDFADSADQHVSWQAAELVIAVPVIEQGRLVAVVVICSFLDDLRIDVLTQLILIAVAALVALALGALLAEPLARWILRPIRYLERAALDFAAGEHHARVPVDQGPPELRVLAETFNHLAEQVQHQVRVQQSFVADASHQLRSPLVALSLRLENLEPHLDADGAERLALAVVEADRMSRILNALLLLARSESHDQPGQPVDALAVLEERVASWRLVATPKSVRIDIDESPGLFVSAIPGTLDQILDVFIDNALRASPSGTSLRLRVVGDSHVVAVQCQDQGPGMSAADRARACDRFWRGPDAESGEGSGLGLAIAASLARANGGEVLLERAPTGGLHAEVRLPAWVPPASGPCPSPAASEGARR
ncbi:sensor histidine kinase [Streptomyces iakyrus]|uniref:histidine kinase n=1 Tax=Streptomyces sp. SID7499 TaxID=2706086 RepID=A0A6G3WVN0_9ACTN|nr:HAMP domain-containing histidine kinase [Streptomyces sp. SID7499]